MQIARVMLVASGDDSRRAQKTFIYLTPIPPSPARGGGEEEEEEGTKDGPRDYPFRVITRATKVSRGEVRVRE